MIAFIISILIMITDNPHTKDILAYILMIIYLLKFTIIYSDYFGGLKDK